VEIELRFYQRLPDGRLLVDGHRLNAEQEKVFRDKIAERLRIANNGRPMERDKTEYAHDLGLSDLLYKYSPRTLAKERLLSLGMSVSDIAHSITGMRELPFYQEGFTNKVVCRMLTDLVAESKRRLARLEHFSESMTLESTTKLHHWTARQAQFERI
jgi:hypothetical protein